MRVEAAEHADVSVWMAAAPAATNEPLAEDATADVCVVGAGIAGLTVAHRLVDEGLDVLVVESGVVAGGETARSAGCLSSALAHGYRRVERELGRDAAHLVADSHAYAIDRIERLVAAERIACDFRRVDEFVVAPEAPDLVAWLRADEQLRDEHAAARRAGLECELALKAIVAGRATGLALRFPLQAEFHPLRYANGLARAIARRGARVHARTRAVAIEASDAPGARSHVVLEHGARVAAHAVVVATHVPIDEIAADVRQGARRTHAVALRLPRRSVEPVLLREIGEPSRAARTTPWTESFDLLVVTGEARDDAGHPGDRALDPADASAQLVAWARERFPQVGPVEYRWSGLVQAPHDGIACIGRDARLPSVWYATGDTMNGLTHATIAGLVIADGIVERPNPWAALYDPTQRGSRVSYARSPGSAATARHAVFH